MTRSNRMEYSDKDSVGLGAVLVVTGKGVVQCLFKEVSDGRRN
jgi:hypothetical protein